MNLAIWDIESSSASTDFGSIIEIGGVLVDENFKEKDRFNLRCRLPEGEVFQAMALIVNKTSIKQLTQTNLSHYQMLAEVEKIFKKWSPAVFLGWSNIGFDDEMIRKEFFKGIRYPYITNASPNKRHDGINIARAAYAVDSSVLETEINEKNNPVFKLESLSRMQGLDSTDAHSALSDSIMTAKVLNIVKKILDIKKIMLCTVLQGVVLLMFGIIEMRWLYENINNIISNSINNINLLSILLYANRLVFSRN